MGRKKAIPRLWRRIGIICSLLISVLFLFFLCTVLKERPLKEEKVTQLNYGYKIYSAYEAALHPNDYYETNRLGMGESYPSSFVKNIKVAVGMAYQADASAKLSGSVKTSIYLQGYIQENGSKTVVWKKLKSHFAEEKIDGQDKEWSYEKIVKVNPSDYQEECDQAMEDFALGTNNELVIVLKGSLKVEKDEAVEIPIDRKISIPVTDGLYKVEKDKDEKQTGSLYKTKMVKEKTNKKRAAVCAVAAVAGLLCAMLLLIKTYPITEKTLQSEQHMLKKKYRNELYCVVGKEGEQYEKRYEMESMKELVRFAQQMELPIFCNAQDEGSFYVIYKGACYEYRCEGFEKE